MVNERDLEVFVLVEKVLRDIFPVAGVGVGVIAGVGAGVAAPFCHTRIQSILRVDGIVGVFELRPRFAIRYCGDEVILVVYCQTGWPS